MKLVSIGLLVIVLFAWIYLLVTDTRVLLEEIKVEPNQTYVVDEYGDLGDSSHASLVCKYFNGRKVLQSVYWYSSNNFMGKDYYKR